MKLYGIVGHHLLTNRLYLEWPWPLHVKSSKSYVANNPLNILVESCVKH